MILKGKTKKGKEIITRWGDKWTVHRHNGDMVLISSNSEPKFDGSLPESTRWIHKVRDFDFEIIPT